MMKKTFVLLCITTVFVLSQLVTGCGGSSGDGDENNSGFITTVDSAGDVGSYSSLVVDGDNLYISYYDATNGDLKFAKSTDGGATWPLGNFETIDSVGDVGWYTSIAVNGTNVYISYLDDTNGTLKFAKSTDGGYTWPAGNIKTIDSVGFIEYNTITVDGANIYISYLDGTNYDLKLAKSTDGGATWPAGNIKTVDSTGIVGQFSSVAINGTNVYISYYDNDNGNLKLAKSTDSGATWPAGNIKTIDSAGDVGMCTSIAVDGVNVYISYYANIDFDLKIAKSTDSGATWLAGNIKTIDSTGNVGGYTSIAINGTNVYISYYDDDNGNLKFAESTDSGATWPAGNIKIVDSAGYVGWYTSIAVNGTNVYISYYDLSNYDLKLAKSTDNGATWQE
jgi:glucose uptake protein GlcU